MSNARAPKKKKLNPSVDFSLLVPIEELSGETKTDTRLLRKMASEANKYRSSFKWCKSFCRSWFGWGVGGVCAVFLFEIDPSSKKADKWL